MCRLSPFLGSQHCCAFGSPASEVPTRHHGRCPRHPHNESKRRHGNGLEAESYFGQCAASCQFENSKFYYRRCGGRQLRFSCSHHQHFTERRKIKPCWFSGGLKYKTCSTPCRRCSVLCKVRPLDVCHLVQFICMWSDFPNIHFPGLHEYFILWALPYFSVFPCYFCSLLSTGFQ